MSLERHQKGRSILLEKLEQMLDTHKQSSLKISEEHIELDISEFPYIMKMACCETIGWNVFLLSKGDVFVQHKETFSLYEKIEELIDELNFRFYDFSTEEGLEIESCMSSLYACVKEVESFSPTLIHEVRHKEPGILHIYLDIPDSSTPKPFIELGFSRIMSRWYIDFHDIGRRELSYLHRNIRTICIKVKRLLFDWNHRYSFSGNPPLQISFPF